MVLSAAGAVLTSLAAAKQPEKTAHSARDSIEALIDEITGSDPEETKALRAFLRRRYLQSASLQESLDATGLSPARARLVGVKARNAMPVRVARLIEDLQNIYVELMKPDVKPPKVNPTTEAPKHG
jgi:anti-sigma factor ChrR (cupin superfamily)